MSDSARPGGLLGGRERALRLLAEGGMLHGALEILVHAAEAESDGGFRASILLLDDDRKHLRHGAAPSLPAEYNQAIDGIEIGPRVGSCGTAAHFGHAIVVTDIARDPLWADFRDLALPLGLRACWSTPFLTHTGAVLGTLALYYAEARGPSELDRDIVKYTATSAAMAVERARVHRSGG